CGSLTLAHATVARVGGGLAPLVDLTNANVIIIGSSFVLSGDAPFLSADSDVDLLLADNNFGRRLSNLTSIGTVGGTDVEQVTTTSCNGCAFANNTTFEPLPFDDDVHPAALSALR